MSKRMTVLRDTRGRPAFAVLPWNDYERMAADSRSPGTADPAAADAAADAARDRRAARAASRRYGTPVDPYTPLAVVRAEVAGLHPVKAWREYRDMTQAELAQAAGMARGYLGQIETRARVGTVDALARLARALSIMVDELLPADVEDDARSPAGARRRARPRPPNRRLGRERRP